MGKGMFSTASGKQQVCLLFFVQVILIVLMGALMTYGPEAKGDRENSRSAKKPDALQIYPMYQDVHVMIWIGFGFLMTFLKRYGQSAVGLTFLIGAILVQVALLCQGVVEIKKTYGANLSLQSRLITRVSIIFSVTTFSLLSADVAVATPLISMGALLGKTTYIQLVFMGILELIMFTVNKYVGEHILMAVDSGDSMFVHAFGAYFGLAVSFVMGMKEKPKEHHLEGPSYNSDIFAMIGTVFLWLFWPSFNSASLQGDDQQRAIINTLLSISASCVIAFAVSALVSKDNKFNMVHIQNSTLAGGVAIGTAAAMMCEPVGALVVGSLAGLLSVLGYKYLTVTDYGYIYSNAAKSATNLGPETSLFLAGICFLEVPLSFVASIASSNRTPIGTSVSPLIQKRLQVHDTCGVHNLHGMPGVLAGIFGALMAGIATETSYNKSLYEIFQARAPSSLEKLAELRDDYNITFGQDRTALQQAGYQLLALAITLGIAIVSGLVTGLILRLSVCGSISEELKFDDEAHWELEDESPHESKVKEGTISGDQLPMATI